MEKHLLSSPWSSLSSSSFSFSLSFYVSLCVSLETHLLFFFCLPQRRNLQWRSDDDDDDETKTNEDKDVDSDASDDNDDDKVLPDGMRIDLRDWLKQNVWPEF